MEIKNFSSSKKAIDFAAQQIANQIKEKPNSVIYLATGQTQLPLYKELVSIYKKDQFSFSKIKVCNLDEYVGLDHCDSHSFHMYMHDNLFDAVDIDHQNIHFVHGEEKDAQDEAERYRNVLKKLGSADLCLLGLGINGHIGFNEPGSDFNSQTRVVKLSESTRKSNSKSFNSLDTIPTKAITIGISEIMNSKKIILVATGDRKKRILQNIIDSDPTKDIPATVLKNHSDVELVTDQKI